jgi:hypothetical protein
MMTAEDQKYLHYKIPIAHIDYVKNKNKEQFIFAIILICNFSYSLYH